MKLELDPVERFLNQCNAAGIKDPVRFLISKLPQTYGWLKGAFPRGILPTDIDGLVEINGHFLLMEFKHEDALRTGRVPKGQYFMLARLIDTKSFTVFMVGTNERSHPSILQILYPSTSSKPRALIDPIDENGVYEQCQKWAQWAERQPQKQ